jgi:glycosyltransferase involved in cell wall biosynthesis
MPPAELYVRLALLVITRSFRLVITKHNDEPFYRGIGWRVVARWVANRACHLIAISDAVNRYVRESLGVSEERISTIHYGIDPAPYFAASVSRVAKLRANWDVDPRGWLIGTVSRLAPQKALHTLIEGYAMYLDQARKPSRLVIVGNGPSEPSLKALATKLGIDAQLIWAGFRDDIPVVMRALDLFVLTSIYEGFGLVLIEAMAAERAIVATEVSAIPEIVVQGRTGVLFPPRDASRLANALLFFEDDSARQTYGRAGYQRVLSYFSLSRMVEGTIHVYDECARFSPSAWS